MRVVDPTGLYGYDAQTGRISHSDGTIIDTRGNVISTPPKVSSSSSDSSSSSNNDKSSSSAPSSDNSKKNEAKVDNDKLNVEVVKSEREKQLEMDKQRFEEQRDMLVIQLKKTPCNSELWNKLAEQYIKTNNAIRVIDDMLNQSSKGFVQLPNTGKGYGSYNRDPKGDDNWGTRSFVEDLISMAAKWSERSPDYSILFGDLSRKEGGKLAPHQTHQKGDDVDLVLLVGGKIVSDMVNPWNKDNYDKDVCQEFVDFLKDEFPQFDEILFGDENIVNLHSKTGNIYEQDELRKSHENHFHIGY